MGALIRKVKVSLRGVALIEKGPVAYCNQPLPMGLIYGSQPDKSASHLQSLSSGTPASADSMCWPHPDQVILPQEEQMAWLHIAYFLPKRREKTPGSFGSLA